MSRRTASWLGVPSNIPARAIAAADCWRWRIAALQISLRGDPVQSRGRPGWPIVRAGVTARIAKSGRRTTWLPRLNLPVSRTSMRRYLHDIHPVPSGIPIRLPAQVDGATLAIHSRHVSVAERAHQHPSLHSYRLQRSQAQGGSPAQVWRTTALPGPGWLSDPRSSCSCASRVQQRWLTLKLPVEHEIAGWTPLS